jgi:hypothetical protein
MTRTVSVIDPFGGFGGTRLLALISLDGVGEDWVELPDQNRLAIRSAGRRCGRYRRHPLMERGRSGGWRSTRSRGV